MSRNAVKVFCSVFLFALMSTVCVHFPTQWTHFTFYRNSIETISQQWRLDSIRRPYCININAVKQNIWFDLISGNNQQKSQLIISRFEACRNSRHLIWKTISRQIPWQNWGNNKEVDHLIKYSHKVQSSLKYDHAMSLDEHEGSEQLWKEQGHGARLNPCRRYLGIPVD